MIKYWHLPLWNSNWYFCTFSPVTSEKLSFFTSVSSVSYRNIFRSCIQTYEVHYSKDSNDQKKNLGQTENANDIELSKISSQLLILYRNYFYISSRWICAVYLLKILNDCGESNDVSELKLGFQKLSGALGKSTASLSENWKLVLDQTHQNFWLLNTTLSFIISKFLAWTSAQTGSQLCGVSILTYTVLLREHCCTTSLSSEMSNGSCKADVRKNNEILIRIGLKCSRPSNMLVHRFFFF